MDDNAQAYENHRIKASSNSCASLGKVVWSPVKSIYISFMFIGAFLAFFYFFSWSALLLFVVTTSVTLCLGHSLGMHRKLIHSSYHCSLWLEYLFVYLGSLVGLGGPVTMVYTHDMRDWAQRQSTCHDYFSHKQKMLKDAWWQIHCDVVLEYSPEFNFYNDSRFYSFLNSTSIFQQIPWAIVFYYFGGWAWVLWGVCVRVTVSVFGHWCIGYFAHNQGEQTWLVDGATVQGYNVNLCSLITFGESWHNNHHAFPGSAKLGIQNNQIDLGWNVLKFLEILGLVSDLKTPDDLPSRPELILK